MIKIGYTEENRFTIQGLTSKQLLLVSYILKGGNNNCYNERIDGDRGDFISGDDYIGMLPQEERNALSEVAKGLEMALQELSG